MLNFSNNIKTIWMLSWTPLLLQLMIWTALRRQFLLVTSKFRSINLVKCNGLLHQLQLIQLLLTALKDNMMESYWPNQLPLWLNKLQWVLWLFSRIWLPVICRWIWAYLFPFTTLVRMRNSSKLIISTLQNSNKRCWTKGMNGYKIIRMKMEHLFSRLVRQLKVKLLKLPLKHWLNKLINLLIKNLSI